MFWLATNAGRLMQCGVLLVKIFEFRSSFVGLVNANIRKVPRIALTGLLVAGHFLFQSKKYQCIRQVCLEITPTRFAASKIRLDYWHLYPLLIYEYLASTPIPTQNFQTNQTDFVEITRFLDDHKLLYKEQY